MVAVVPPVERWMRVEDCEPAHQQEREAGDVDPVREPHRDRLPVDDLTLASVFAWLVHPPGPVVPDGMLAHRDTARRRWV